MRDRTGSICGRQVPSAAVAPFGAPDGTTTAPTYRISGDATAPDLRSMIDNGGPRLRRMAALHLESPGLRDDGNGAIDIVASFNGLPKAERKGKRARRFLESSAAGTEPASHGIAYRQTEA